MAAFLKKALYSPLYDSNTHIVYLAPVQPEYTSSVTLLHCGKSSHRRAKVILSLGNIFGVLNCIQGHFSSTS